jgi:hypothetical protein
MVAANDEKIAQFLTVCLAAVASAVDEQVRIRPKIQKGSLG